VLRNRPVHRQDVEKNGVDFTFELPESTDGQRQEVQTLQKIRTEITSPVFDLPWLVAKDEGLFDEEGLQIEFMAIDGDETRTNTAATDWNKVTSLRGHGSRHQKQEANIYSACEWGNYRRAQDGTLGGRQIGRRASVACCAIIVPPWSEVYTPQQLANKLIAVPFHNGSHYAAIQMLEGFLPRDLIKLCDSGKRHVRYDSLMNGEVDATTLLEPWITAAEKASCRVITQSFYHGSEVAGDEIDGVTYLAINRAVTKAVQRINANKRKYVRYYLEHDYDHPAIAALKPEDIPLSRLQFIEPSTIPDDEFQRTYEWMVSWNLIEGGHSIEGLVDTTRQRESHSVTTA